MDEGAFAAFRGGGGGGGGEEGASEKLPRPARSRPAPSTRVEKVDEGAADAGAPAPEEKKKKGWSVFSKKS
jgi:hypothetical protein